jgi:hypothetical protein
MVWTSFFVVEGAAMGNAVKKIIWMPVSLIAAVSLAVVTLADMLSTWYSYFSVTRKVPSGGVTE